jgi:hypothetical protein
MADIFALVGFVLLLIGCWMLSPAVALIVAGSIVMTVGVAGHFYRMRPRQ